MNTNAAPITTWLGRHRWITDALIVTAIGGYEAMYISMIHHQWGLGAWVWAAVILAVVMCGVFPLRRRRPITACLAVVAASWAQLFVGVGFSPGAVVINALMLYAIATRFTWFYVGPLLVAVASWLIIAGHSFIVEGTLRIGELGLMVTAAGLVAVLGSLARQRRQRLEALADRAAQLARERDTREQIAAAEERARIAREMHDLISHSLGTMVVMADGAAHAADSDPARARQAMEQVRDTGRGAMAEMRRMLDVLREDDPASRAPQPGLGELDRLLSEAHSAGLRVDLHVQGEPVDLPAGPDLAAYRIIQEALTNARTHGGPLLSLVTIDLIYHHDVLELRIEDDGSEPDQVDTPSWSTGHGLVGMRERAQAYGGHLDAGPRPGGGFTVYATIPIGEHP